MSAHDYLSTGCLHGDLVLPDGRTGHEYCQGDTGEAGAKRPAECKFCGASCRCSCHRAVRAAGRRRGEAARQLGVIRELTARLLALRTRRQR